MRESVTLVLVLTAAACGGQAPMPAPTPQTAPGAPSSAATGCARTSVGLTPLSDLTGSYQGQAGGLYPGGSNTPPPYHLAAGSSLASSIGPLDAEGNANANGRYVFLSIGMSNTTQEFSTFKPLADADAAKHPRLVIVDGAQGGVTANQWASASCPCWGTVDARLTAAGVTPRQVVAAWVKLANANPTQAFPVHAQLLRDNIIAALRNLKARYPNLRLAYVSSRIYAGYATTALNPEPYAYESAFAVRDVIAAQLNGSLNDAPWVAWGPYLWADGLTPRSDGLTWACSELADDGTHPSVSGRRKVADQLLAFVKSDPTARIWFSR